MATINTLDANTCEVLTASYAVPDLQTAIQQVIYNSIDAHAKTITISVDVMNASFVAEDDGDGIMPDDLYNYIGECHASSRISYIASRNSENRQLKKTYGKRGAFLFELASLAATLEIESRVQNHWTSHRKVVKKGSVVYNARSKELREAPGTTVSVSHLFGRLPVRRKDLSRNEKHRARVVRGIQTFCVNMSMIWPSLAFDVRFEDQGARPLRIAAAKSCRERFLESFGQLLGHELHYVDFVSKLSRFSIRGYFAFVPVGSEGLATGIKQAKTYYQFAFLENEWVQECQQVCSRVITEAALESLSAVPIFVLKVAAPREQYDIMSLEKGSSVIFKCPELFDQFLVEFVQDLAAAPHQAETCEGPHRADIYSQEPSDLAEREKAAHISADASSVLHPPYVRANEGLSTRDRGNGGATDFLVQITDHDLENQDESLLSYKDAAEVASLGSGSPFREYFISDQSTQGIQTYDTFEAYGGIADTTTEINSIECSNKYLRSRDEPSYPGPACYIVPDEDYVGNSASQSCSKDNRSSSEDFLADIFFSGCGNHRTMQVLPESAITTEEVTTEMPWVSSKPDSYDFIEVIQEEHGDTTYNCPQHNDPDIQSKQKQCADIDASGDVDVEPQKSESKDDSKSRFFAENTVCCMSTQVSRRGSIASLNYLAASLNVDNVHGSRGLQQVKISKSILANLEVICQVDRKFILVQADTLQGNLLLCIDQHAADERVRLEKLEENMFGVDGSRRDIRVHEHEPPLVLRVNATERTTLDSYKELIESWGFKFEFIISNPDRMFLHAGSTPDNPGEGNVLLYTTPKVEKRVSSAADFREFIQLLAGIGVSTPYANIRPPVITRLLHSRACRSAIMFGDWLSIGQCKDLIEELKACQLPFQCAHGRPSVVSLAAITYENSAGK